MPALRSAPRPDADFWARFAARADIPDDMEPLTALENLHLVREGRMTKPTGSRQQYRLTAAGRQLPDEMQALE